MLIESLRYTCVESQAGALRAPCSSTAYLIPTCSLAESNSLNRWLLSDYICWGAGSDSKSGSIVGRDLTRNGSCCVWKFDSPRYLPTSEWHSRNGGWAVFK